MIRRFLASSGVLDAEAVQLGDDRPGASRRRGARSPRPRASERRLSWEERANGPRRVNRCSSRAAEASRSRSDGVWASTAPPSSRIVGVSSARKAGSRCRPAAISARRVGAVRRGPARLAHPARDVAGGCRPGRRATVSPSRTSLPSVWFWLARIRRTRSVSRSAGLRPADRLVELVAAGGEADAELAEDDPQPLAVGPAHDVGEQVGGDGRAGLRRPGSRAPSASLCGIRPRPAVEEVLADQRLRPALAERVRAQGAEAVLGRPRCRPARRASRVQAQPGDRPGADAGDLEVRAGRPGRTRCRARP